MRKQTCSFNPSQMGYVEGELDENGEIIDRNRAGLFGLISDNCKLRMSDPNYLNITSQIYLGVFGCKYDDVKMPFIESRIHKERIGVFIVCLDVISIMLMIYFFTKINTLNNEFLGCMDDLRVQMKDFGVKINNVKLDKFTYDSRVVKIKVWLHFQDVLEPFKTPYNDMECIDVCLSLYT